MKFLSSCLLVLAGTVLAHSPKDKKLEDSDLSLPDLERSDVLDAPSWTVTGSALFENGRILMTPGSNINSHITNGYELAYESWTIESVFRSMGSFGKTSSGLSLNLVRDHNLEDSSFFGGAAKFEGLKVVVDSDSKAGSSIHAFLNDGSVDFSKFTGDALYDHAFGSCLLKYQESQVPTTLRISSYAGTLVIQVNNKVCIQTKQVKIPKNFKLGISASTCKTSKEVFELFRLKTYGGVISEISENEGKSAVRANLVTEIINIDQVKEQDKPKVSAPNIEHQLSEYLVSMEDIQKSNKEMLDLFLTLDSKIAGLATLASAGAPNPKGRPELSHIAEQAKNIQQLSTTMESVTEKLNKLDLKLVNLDISLKAQVDSLATRLDQLQSDFMSQIQDNQRTISQNIAYLVESEKENNSNLALVSLITTLKYLIIPILLISVGLSVFAYTLRHEIKQKLL